MNLKACTLVLLKEIVWPDRDLNPDQLVTCSSPVHTMLSHRERHSILLYVANHRKSWKYAHLSDYKALFQVHILDLWSCMPIFQYLWWVILTTGYATARYAQVLPLTLM